jgi:hypothetical protein
MYAILGICRAISCPGVWDDNPEATPQLRLRTFKGPTGEPEGTHRPKSRCREAELSTHTF